MIAATESGMYLYIIQLVVFLIFFTWFLNRSLKNPMTPKQALAACVKIDPKRLYCAHCLYWRRPDGEQRVDFAIDVAPGFTHASQRFVNEKGFRFCVEAYRRTHNEESKKY